MEPVFTVSMCSLVVTVASSGDESDSGRTVELSSDSGIEEMVGGRGLGYRHQDRRNRSPTPVFQATDLRLRLSNTEMSRIAAERRAAIPRRRRRPDHQINFPARAPPVFTITCDRSQSPFRSVPQEVPSPLLPTPPAPILPRDLQSSSQGEARPEHPPLPPSPKSPTAHEKPAQNIHSHPN